MNLSDKKQPLINILVRTSNRPNYFSFCYQSIYQQDYKNIRLIVSYDDISTKEYLKDYKIDKRVGVKRTDDWNKCFVPECIQKPFPPNEYFNEMMRYCKRGYIIYLDDDDKFMCHKALSKIISKLTHERQMIFWRVQFPGYLIPDNNHFGSPPVCCQISTIGFMFHTDYIKYAIWDGFKYGDFRTAMSLYLRIPEKIYVNEVLTGLQSLPGLGKRNDLPTKATTSEI